MMDQDDGMTPIGESRAWNHEVKVRAIQERQDLTRPALVGKKSNMETLLENFHATQNYPVYYLGKAEQTALCICPYTNTEEWFNVKNLVITHPPKKGMMLLAYKRENNKLYEKVVVFMSWEKKEIHEWMLTNGDVLQLRQDFVDGLNAKDRRYLKI